MSAAPKIIETPLGQVTINKVAAKTPDFLDEGLVLLNENGNKIMAGDRHFEARMTPEHGQFICEVGFTELGAVANALAAAARSWALSQPDFIVR